MKKSIFILLLGSLAMGATAQTENPRGIYKMMMLKGKVGEVKAPFAREPSNNIKIDFFIILLCMVY